MSSIRKIAEQVGMKISLVRDVLKEVPGTKVTREAVDRIFHAARTLKYDLKKLKIGKQMAMRKSTLLKVLEQIEENPDWMYSVDVQQSGQLGLLMVMVTVEQTPNSASNPISMSVVRLMPDPEYDPLDYIDVE